MKKLLLLLLTALFTSIALAGTALAIPVVNFSFEEPALVDGAWVDDSVTGWSFATWSNGVVQTYDPGAEIAAVPDGENVAVIGGGGIIYQALNDGVPTGSTEVTLSVDIGRSGYGLELSPFSIGVYEGTEFDDDNLIASYYSTMDPVSLAPGEFTTLTLSGIADISAPLMIAFCAQGVRGQTQLLIDNVQVNTAHAPEPATLLLLGSGLAGLAGVRRRMKK